MRMANASYVYRWIRLDTNTPFYVGKGTGKRYKQTKSGRNQYFRNILRATSCEVEKVMENLTDYQAFTKEKEFIRLYKSLGYCEANLTDGGEGITNPSPETIKRLSDSHKGNIPKNKGLKFTEQQIQNVKDGHWSRGEKAELTREKLSKRHKELKAYWNNKQIKATNIQTGNSLTFISARVAAKTLGCCFKKISAVANGKRKTHKGFLFSFINQELNEEL